MGRYTQLCMPYELFFIWSNSFRVILGKNSTILFFSLNQLISFFPKQCNSFISLLCDCLFNRCFECNEELSTHCNKKALAQTLDFLQKHSVKAASGNLFGCGPWQFYISVKEAFCLCAQPNLPLSYCLDRVKAIQYFPSLWRGNIKHGGVFEYPERFYLIYFDYGYKSC